jgi:hypothetical protein
MMTDLATIAKAIKVPIEKHGAIIDLGTTSWLKNRLLSRVILGHTPYELVHGTKPNLSQVHEFSTPVLVHVLEGGKLEPHAEEAIFVGVDGKSKGYWVYWLMKWCVSVEWNVMFVLSMVIIADGVQAEGEYTDMQQTISVQEPLQTASPEPPQTPSTPPIQS